MTWCFVCYKYSERRRLWSSQKRMMMTNRALKKVCARWKGGGRGGGGGGRKEEQKETHGVLCWRLTSSLWAYVDVREAARAKFKPPVDLDFFCACLISTIQGSGDFTLLLSVRVERKARPCRRCTVITLNLQLRGLGGKMDSLCLWWRPKQGYDQV